MKKKPIIIILIIVIHVITNLVLQYKMLGYLISGKTFVETNIPFGFILWLVLLCIDFFVCSTIVNKSDIEIKHNKLLHCIDLILIIPALFTLFIFWFPFDYKYETFVLYCKREAYEITLTVGIIITDVLLIIERIIQIKR